MSRGLHVRGFPPQKPCLRQDKQDKMPPSETSLSHAGQSRAVYISLTRKSGANRRDSCSLYKCCFAGMHAMKKNVQQGSGVPNDCVNYAAVVCVENPLCKPQFLKKQTNKQINTKHLGKNLPAHYKPTRSMLKSNMRCAPGSYI